MHEGTLLYSVHYYSDVFYVITGIWWDCDDDEITQISNFLEGIYTIESHKKKDTRKKVMSAQTR